MMTPAWSRVSPSILHQRVVIYTRRSSMHMLNHLWPKAQVGASTLACTSGVHTPVVRERETSPLITIHSHQEGRDAYRRALPKQREQWRLSIDVRANGGDCWTRFLRNLTSDALVYRVRVCRCICTCTASTADIPMIVWFWFKWRNHNCQQYQGLSHWTRCGDDGLFVVVHTVFDTCRALDLIFCSSQRI